MKRLTERDEFGNADIIALSDMMPEFYAGLSFSETNALTDVLNRLADYEDTGLTPGEITDLLNKQIPRKPDAIDDALGFFECPSCKKAINYGADRTDHKYCLNCGQSLDWGDEE